MQFAIKKTYGRYKFAYYVSLEKLFSFYLFLTFRGKATLIAQITICFYLLNYMYIYCECIYICIYYICTNMYVCIRS